MNQSAAVAEIDESLLLKPGCHIIDSMVIWGGCYTAAAILDRVAWTWCSAVARLWTWCSAVARLMIHQMQRLHDMGVMNDEVVEPDAPS